MTSDSTPSIQSTKTSHILFNPSIFEQLAKTCSEELERPTLSPETLYKLRKLLLYRLNNKKITF